MWRRHRSSRWPLLEIPATEDQRSTGSPHLVTANQPSTVPRGSKLDNRYADFSRHIVFYRNFRVLVLPQKKVAVLQRFPANCLYGGRNRLQVAV
jgi:hypothetical protein